MPWIYNATPETQEANAADGSLISFPSRKKTYVKPEQMSAYVWNLVRARKLANRGGDPKPAPVAPAKVPVVKVTPKPDTKAKTSKPARFGNVDTSSSHHKTRAKVANESSSKRPSRKKTKAEKKQSATNKKEDTQSNLIEQTKADAAEIPTKRSKRTFKRKD
jgi:hypothetical protein